MNRIILILAITFCLNVFSQKHYSFLDKFNDLSSPYIFDELEYNTSKYPVINYNLIEKILRTPFDKPYINVNNLKRNTFFAIGKIKIRHFYGLLILNKYSFKDEVEKTLYLAIFTDNHKLAEFTKIGDLSFIKKINNNIVVYPNGEIFKIIYDKDDLLKYKIYKIQYYPKNKEVKVNFMQIKKDTVLNDKDYYIESRKYKKYFFDHEFLSKKILIVPIRTVLNFKKSKSLFSIKGNKEKNFDSFFIDCFYINEKKITIILNRYNYLNFNKVSDVYNTPTNSDHCLS